MKIDKITVNEKEYKVFIHLEQRNGSRVSIGKSGVNIRIPSGMPREQQFKELIILKHWAAEKLQEKQPEIKTKGSKTHIDREKLRVGNEEYLLRLTFSEKQISSAKAIGNTFLFY